MSRDPEQSRIINITHIEDHQEEEDDEDEEEEDGEVSKLINIKENKVVRINISSEGMPVWQWNDNVQWQGWWNVLDAIMDAETERYLSEVEQEGITKEQDEEIMKLKQRQVTVKQ